MNGRQSPREAPILDHVLDSRNSVPAPARYGELIAASACFVCQYNPHVAHLNKSSKVFCMSFFFPGRLYPPSPEGGLKPTLRCSRLISKYIMQG